MFLRISSSASPIFFANKAIIVWQYRGPQFDSRALSAKIAKILPNTYLNLGPSRSSASFWIVNSVTKRAVVAKSRKARIWATSGPTLKRARNAPPHRPAQGRQCTFASTPAGERPLNENQHFPRPKGSAGNRTSAIPPLVRGMLLSMQPCYSPSACRAVSGSSA